MNIGNKWEKTYGNLTIGENIADNGGLREAFMAYKKWKRKNEDIAIPGLSNFTQDQLFFIGNAQVWCGKYTEARAMQLQAADVHSPGKFRVNVVNSNYKEFGKAFSCKMDEDPMYPQEADICRVW